MGGGDQTLPLLTLILTLPLTQHSPLSPTLTRWEEGIKRDMKSLRSSTTGREIPEERLVAPAESGGPTANLRGYRATAALASPTPDPDAAPHRELYRRAHPCPCPSDSHVCYDHPYEYRCPPHAIHTPPRLPSSALAAHTPPGTRAASPMVKRTEARALRRSRLPS